MTQSAKEFLEEYKGSRLGCYEFFSHFFGDKRVQPLLDVFPMVEALSAEKMLFKWIQCDGRHAFRTSSGRE